MRNNAHRRIRRNGQQYSLFFIKPKERTDAHKRAESLARMANVTEVMVTEGECGFIVKAKATPHEANSRRQVALARNSYKKIASYYQYRK